MDDEAKGRIKTAIIVIAIVMALAMGVWFGLPAYRNWKQERFLKQAQEFLEKDDFRNASLCARKVLAVNPSNVAACRIMVRICEAARAPELLAWSQRVAELEPDVLQNHLHVAKVAFVQGDLARARIALETVHEAGRQSAAFHEMAGLLAVATNQINLSEQHLAEAARLDPANKQLQLNLAVLHLQSRDQETVDGAKKRLEELSTDEKFRTDALRILLAEAMRTNDLTRARSLADRLTADPGSSFNDRLLRLTILAKASRPDFTNDLAQLQQEAAAKPQDVASLVRWMIAQDMADPAFQWVAGLPAESQTTMPVTLASVDLHMARKDWTGLESLLETRQWEGLEFVRHALLARVAAEHNEGVTRQAHWRTALREGGDQIKPLHALLQMARAWQWEDETEELLWQIVQRFPKEKWTLQELERRYLTAGNTWGLNKVYSTLLEYAPNDVLAMNNFAATSLLLKSNPARAHDLAKQAYEQRPTDPMPASTYAFSLHLQGRTADGLQVLAKLPSDQLQVPAVAAYYGILLAAAGETNQARAYLERAERSRLLPEEKALLQDARHSL